MFTRIQIDGLRGIANADLDGLAPVTLLLGSNGSGKSTVLEAIGVACANNSAEATFQALAKREWLGLEGMKYWFTKDDGTSTITAYEGRKEPAVTSSLLLGAPLPLELEEEARKAGAKGDIEMFSGSFFLAMIDEEGELYKERSDKPFKLFSLESLSVDRPVGARRRYVGKRFSNALRTALKELKLKPYYDEVVQYLRILRPNLSSIENLAVGDRDEPFVIENNPRIVYPLSYAGDGFRRIMLIAGALAGTKGGVVAIDEPEAYAHPRLFAVLAQMTRRACVEGTQIVMATHSLEFVKATLTEFENDTDKIAVIGLSNERGSLNSVVITGPNACRRVVELGDDLRL
jgi:energy-coupling factor transporter ATP-binding protein EcfA2